MMFLKLWVLAVVLVGGTKALLICPGPAEISPCTCSSLTQEIFCIGPDITQQTLTNLMLSLSTANPTGGDIKTLKVSETNIQKLDTQVLAGNNTYTLMDLSSNKNLQFLYDKILGSDWGKLRIKAKKVTFSNCKLRWDEERFMTDALNRFLDPDEIDLSYNNIIELSESNRFYSPDTLQYSSNIVVNLSHNYITDVRYHWFHLIPNAKSIDLSFNRIKNLWNEAFSQINPSPVYVDEYLTINLSNNRLSETSTYYRTIFEKLKRPTKLLLNYNLFSFLPEAPFYSFLRSDIKNEIYIGNNTLTCNSKSKWLQDYKMDFKDRVLGYRCENFGGKLIFDITPPSQCSVTCVKL